MTPQWWTAVPAALIARITVRSQRFPWPDFTVIAASCDQAKQAERQAVLGGRLPTVADLPQLP
jgi:hypothetical protein